MIQIQKRFFLIVEESRRAYVDLHFSKWETLTKMGLTHRFTVIHRHLFFVLIAATQETILQIKISLTLYLTIILTQGTTSALKILAKKVKSSNAFQELQSRQQDSQSKNPSAT